MILVDTSAWVEFDRATGSVVDRRLTQLIAETDEVCVTEAVVMAVVAGARDDRSEQELHRLMGRFTLLRLDAVVDFDGAARIYRRCRRAGVTPRGMVDCLIAAVALRRQVSVLCADRDFERMAAAVGLSLASCPTPVTGGR